MSIKMLARVGEYGFIHQIDTGTDYSASYSAASIHYRDPSGNVTEKTCDSVVAADGTFGYTVEDGFFDEVGRWEATLELDLGASGIRKSQNPIVFWVGADGE
jgi:hypothetical protein